MEKNEIFRKLPKIDKLMDEPRFDGHHRAILREAARTAVEEAREKAAADGAEPDMERIADETEKIYTSLTEGSLKQVVNATGVPIHTNLGRAPIPRVCFEEAQSIVCGYSNLEYDVKAGKRGDRYHHASAYLRMMTGAEDAVIVNNNASAVFLVLNTLCKGKEAIVSRGELVEIGGSFRVPDVMKQSGAKLVEVGTTNKTRIADYIDAVTPKTGIMMKVHKSNYEIVGFSEEAGLDELARAAETAGVPSYYDAGSGQIIKILPDCICADRPLVELMKTGVDLISFSGDKMMGGCQAGIIIGRKELIKKIKKNPLMRMLRVDKMTLAVLQSVLKLYITGHYLDIPVNSMMAVDIYDIKARAETLAAMLKGFCDAEVIPVKSTIGGGSCPMAQMDSFAVEIRIKGMTASRIDKHLRSLDTPIIARTGDNVFFDARTLRHVDLSVIRDAVEALIR